MKFTRRYKNNSFIQYKNEKSSNIYYLSSTLRNKKLI